MTQIEETEQLTKLIAGYIGIQTRELTSEEIDFVRNVVNLAYISGSQAAMLKTLGVQTTESQESEDEQEYTAREEYDYAH